jgi:hypothetical protein
MTARERALWTFGEGDDLLDAQDREGVIEAGAPDLSRVTAAPGRPPKRPADLRALGTLQDGLGHPASPDGRAGGVSA